MPPSDHSASPEKQAEQIMSIYPIVDGQKPGGENSIPARHSTSKSGSDPVKTEPNSESTGDLIDFGGNDTPASEQAPLKPHDSKSGKEPDDIEALLSSTGKPAAHGPLLDFSQDMKKDLPTSPSQDLLG